MGLYDYLRQQGILTDPSQASQPMQPMQPMAPQPQQAAPVPQGTFGPDVEAALNKYGFATDNFAMRLFQGLGAAGSQDPMAAAAGFLKNRQEMAKAEEDKKRQENQDKLAIRKITLEELKASKPVIQSSGVPGYSIAIYPDGRVEQIVNDAAVEAYNKSEEAKNLRQQAQFNQQTQLLDRRLESAETIAANRQAAADRKGARLNPSLQKEEDNDFGMIDGAKGAANDIQPVIENLKTGTLQLGALRNAYNASRNFFGSSTPESQAFAELERGITRITNESLRLNKGVQTEGDAQRAAKEVIAAFGKNDTALMTKALEDLQRINLRAAENKARMIDRRRTSQGVEPIFGAQSPVGTPAPNATNNDPLGLRNR
jgi:hypothetical protein